MSHHQDMIQLLTHRVTALEEENQRLKRQLKEQSERPSKFVDLQSLEYL